MKVVLALWIILIIALLLALHGCSPCPDDQVTGCSSFPTAAPRQ